MSPLQSPSALQRRRGTARVLVVFIALLLSTCLCLADDGAPADSAVRTLIEEFMTAQTLSLPGKVSLDIELKPSHPLPPCKAMQPFLPLGSAAMGRISVGLRCSGAAPWTRFVSTYVSVEGRYLAAAHAIEAGRAIEAADVQEKTGDLSRMPRSVLLAGASVAGTVAVTRIGAGVPLRKEMVRGTLVVRQGQTVNLVAQGAGFTIRTEGVAMTAGEAGALVRARSSDNRMVSGIADKDGSVLLSSTPPVTNRATPTP